jgi:hypothetical protein
MLVIWAGMAAGVLIASHQLDPSLFPLSILFAGALFAVGVVSTIDWGRPIWPFVTGLTWAVAIFIAATLFLPNIDVLNVGKSAGTAMAEIHDDYPDLHFAAFGYEEPSLVFYANGHIDLFSRDDRSETDSLNEMIDTVGFFPRANPTKHYLVVLDDRILARIHKEHPAFLMYPLRHFTGINTNGLKPVSVTLVSNVILPKYTFVPTTITAPATLPDVPPRP